MEDGETDIQYILYRVITSDLCTFENVFSITLATLPLKILGHNKQYTSLCNFLQSPFTSFLFGPNILLSACSQIS
jgi:hypothetical protein